MAESRSGLQKKVSSIFESKPVQKTGEGQQKAIAPLLAKGTSLPPALEEKKKDMEVNLIRFRKSGEQKAIRLPSTITVIGRRSNCDLRIPVISVSKRHCQINCDDGSLKIRDLGSRNGTLLNGIRINEALIQPGDWVQIGPIGFVFQINGQPEKVIPPAVKKEEKPKPKKEKIEAKAEKKSAAKTENEIFDDLDDSGISSILDDDIADVKESSGGADMLIDDSELLQDMNLDDLGEPKSK